MNIEAKISKLILKVNEYVKYTVWTNVGVTLKDDMVFITWFNPLKKDGDVYLDYTLRHFNIDDIDDRLIGFKNKIQYEKRKMMAEYMNNIDPEKK